MKQFPGPNATRILQKAEKYYATNTQSSRIVVERGNGATVVDVDGNEFYDLHCDASVNNLGRNNIKLANAITRQLRTGNIFSEHHNAANEHATRLAEWLAEKSPVPKPAKVFFSNSGAEANEAARKLCRAHRMKIKETNRVEAVYFTRGFAGRTKGVVAATSSNPECQRDPFWDHCDKKNSIYIPYPRLHHFADALNAFDRIDLSGVDRVLIELSCQGEGGIIPADGYAVSVMRQKTKQAGVLWIVDAVQCGMGRDGSLFGCDTLSTGHLPSIDPDIVTLGKALGGGLPIGATIFRSDLDFAVGQHSNTFGGGPLVMSAACAAFAQIESIVKAGSVEHIEKILVRNLSALWTEHGDIMVAEPRGIGAMWALEFTSPEIRNRLIAIGEELVVTKRRGVRLLGAGKKAIRFMPPLTIQPEELEQALGLFALAIEQYKTEQRPLAI